MKICHVSAEISPIAKVGGLADVITGLSRELQHLGHEVFVILPKYACLKTNGLSQLKIFKRDLKTFFNSKWHFFSVFQAQLHGIPVYFIDSTAPESYFDRDKIYGYPDDTIQFAFFSKAALDFILQCKPDLDILHLHEWHTALMAPLYKLNYSKNLRAKVIFTIHNLSYQGEAPFNLLKKVGLNPEQSPLKENLQDPSKANKINLMKGAILYSDFITTVSPQYGEEIQTAVNGHGLQGVISREKHKLRGILNGIDPQIWNPQTDQALAFNFDHNTLDKKCAVKNSLQQLLKMPREPKSPLVACICRLVPQKGIRLIKKAILSVLEFGGQFILFGSSPIPKIQLDFQVLKEELQSDSNVKFIFDSYNEDLAHKIYAASDMFICPSIFEPCGLTQLIALRYGSIPIVRKTGGLANTVFDIEYERENETLCNGFTFVPPTSKAVHETLKRAFKIYFEQPHLWKELIQRGMQMDYSWKESAKAYLEVYTSTFDQKKAIVCL
jgi:starch synthase